MKMYTFRVKPMVQFTEDGEWTNLSQEEFDFTLEPLRVISDSQAEALTVAELAIKENGRWSFYVSHVHDSRGEIELFSVEELVNGMIL